MSRLHKAAKSALVGQAFNWAGLLLSLATVPLYLRWLGQERYGVLLTGLAFASYLMFSDAGLTWASMLLIAQANGRGDRNTIAAILRNSFSLAACSALLASAIVATAFWVLKRQHPIAWLPHQPEFPGLLLAIGVSVVGNLCLSPFYNLFIGMQEAHLAAIYQGSGRLSGTLAAVVVASTGVPLGWVFAGNVAGALGAGLLAAVHCRRRHAWAFQSGSIWEKAQIRLQLRTGAKSIIMQAGNVFWGSAPVLAISSAAGPQFVPLFSIPMTLLNAPLGVLSSFSANLQPGYGEAMGRGETQWVADTVRRILRQVIVVVGLLTCGFLLLAAPFVRVWTGGRIELEPKMLASVLAIAVVGAVLSVFRFALTGINRHRLASISDLLCGALAIGLSVLAVRRFGHAFIGLGIVAAAGLTSGWVLPVELRRTLRASTFWPSWPFWLRWLAIVSLAFAVGWILAQDKAFLPVWLIVLTSALAISLVFVFLSWKLLPEETNVLLRLFRRITVRLSGNSAAA
jgi:O-antigen/teichoic acid export membrane protein